MNFKIVQKSTALMAAFLFLISGCNGKQPEIISKQGYFFDTVIQLSASGQRAEETLDEAFVLCEELEAVFSRTRTDSELYALNHRTGDRVEVSEHLATVIRRGLYYYELSEGRFDITIAPVSELWDFKAEKPMPPDAQQLAAAVRRVDGSALSLTDRTVVFSRSDTMLDLGGLAKGYAADCIKELYLEQGITSGMINLGGNVLCVGSKPDGSPWNVGIRRPFEPEKMLQDTIQVTDRSVVSSGVYERCFEMAGDYYHHILDATTGYPVKTDLWQATVVTDSSLEGDALSTVCMLLGAERATTLLLELDSVAQWILVDDHGVEHPSFE